MPSGLRISANVSQPPTAVRLAISGSAPAFSAQTSSPLTRARSAMLPLPRSICSNCSHGPIAGALAISGAAPALAALTYCPLARARRLIEPPLAPAPSPSVDAVPRSVLTLWFAVPVSVVAVYADSGLAVRSTT